MATELIHQINRNGTGTAFMILSVVSYSMVPLLLARGGGVESPFLFMAGLRIGQFCAHGAFLTVFFKDVLFDKTALTIVIHRVLSWSMLFLVINNLDYVFFALATSFVDISVAAILYETWPIALILLTALLFRGEARYRKITPEMMLLLVIGFVGFWFVATSQSGGFRDLSDSQLAETLIGIGLVLLAIFCASMAAYGFRWGVDLNHALPEQLVKDKNNDLVDICCVLIAQVIASFTAAWLSGTTGYLIGETIALRSLGIAVACGVFANGVGHLAWRAANVVTNNLGINAISYATPIFSLVWLFLFWTVDIARVDYLIIGTAAIITANLLINFEAEVRFGFKALVLALWTCGTFVYLRDEFLHLLPFGGWLWPRETYLGALGFSATVFILLLSFRVARIAPRTQDEDNRIFALHRNLELLARRGLIAPEASEHLRAIDGARNVEELQVAYTRVKLCFVQAAAVDHTLANRRLLVNAETQLNMMVHSRQQGVDFGELFSLIIFGGSTILLSLLSRPEVSGWTAFLYEVFSALFPAVIVFLIVNVWDLHRDRAELVLTAREGPESYGVIFRDPRSRRFEQGVSVVIGLLIIVAYAVLLWYKWVG